jgi:hypothetical protein
MSWNFKGPWRAFFAADAFFIVRDRGRQRRPVELQANARKIRTHPLGGQQLLSVYAVSLRGVEAA